jgi:hypothetical protein
MSTMPEDISKSRGNFSHPVSLKYPIESTQRPLLNGLLQAVIQNLPGRSDLTSLSKCFTLLSAKHTAREMPKQQFEQEAGWETELSELVYFNLYKSQLPVVEQAIEIAALMLGTNTSLGYCLEMMSADFLAGVNLDNENPKVLLQSATVFRFLPREEADISATRYREGVMTGCNRNVAARGSIPSGMNTSAIKCYAATVGDTSRAAQCPSSRSTTKTCAATSVTILARI